MMFSWLIRYVEAFGKEFPLRLFVGHPEYQILQIVMDCVNSGTPYPESEAVEEPNDEVKKVEELKDEAVSVEEPPKTTRKRRTSKKE